ncbi:3-oxoacyl-ACP reductase FabG [Natronocalculus amylovorans]|uniref:3-oxoacyl-ACP reductase FabG n=1 Tax=Natronocalculus amylovorans TaxID=2917812 RepID=A0AAE3K727_9EURY|nr:3-oxoacyl-ACP reductase FabG [Natronocalculus amylovorans]MCL9815561.1 3-oxoacyl-ACP reductase FabG [Natronocalculus amylovorans]
MSSETADNGTATGTDERVALVTGAGHGIGRGIAHRLAADGYAVSVVDIDEDAAHEVADEIHNLGEQGDAIALPADVTDLATIEMAVEATVDSLGGIDVVVANVGVYPSGRIDALSVDSWHEIMDINLAGAFRTVKASLPALKQSDSGRIVLTSSITGPMTGYPGWAHYGATKAGLLGFMRSAALELAPEGITINAVLPGNVKTEQLEALGDEYIEEMTESVPLGTLGTPEDIGAAVAFLASKDAGFITGHPLVIDGGQTLPESQAALSEMSVSE